MLYQGIFLSSAPNQERPELQFSNIGLVFLAYYNNDVLSFDSFCTTWIETWQLSFENFCSRHPWKTKVEKQVVAFPPNICSFHCHENNRPWSLLLVRSNTSWSDRTCELFLCFLFCLCFDPWCCSRNPFGNAKAATFCWRHPDYSPSRTLDFFKIVLKFICPWGQ